MSLTLRAILSQGDWIGCEVEQFGKIQPASFGQLLQSGEGDVQFPAGFDLLVMLVGKTGALGERLLTEAQCLPEGPNPCHQACRRVVCHDRA